jgi:sirohydrochlorin ferrochelatase
VNPSGTLAIVLLFHGSRAQDAALSERALCEAVRAQGVAENVQPAHLAGPLDLQQAVQRCHAGGAREVVVVPMFVTAGLHAVADTPRLVEAARARFPDMEIRATQQLGQHPALAALVAELVRAASGG